MADSVMESEVSDNSALILAIIVGGTVLLIFYISNLLRSQKKEDEEKIPHLQSRKKETVRDKAPGDGSAASTHKSTKKKQLTERGGRDSKQQSFTHPWLVTSLKGHSSCVLDMDFSSNGKYLATCAEDRTVFIWNTKDFTQKDHKSLRINIEFDHAKFIKWSPDSKAFIIHKGIENVIEVYKLTKKTDGSGFSGATKAITFPKHYVEEVVGTGIACSGRFIMTCNDRTQLVLWDLKGQQLGSIDTYLMNTICARVSPCGRFVAASGFAPDVKIWEVVFSKSGDYQTTSRAFELRGHTSGILDFNFSCDSSRMATVSKDGTWKTFDTKIEYHKGEDPHLLQTVPYTVATDGTPSRIALSPDGQVVALAAGTTLSLYSASTGTCDAVIRDVHTASINCILFDSTGKYVLTSGDKHVRVFHNVTGYHTKLQALRASAKSSAASQSSAMKERIQQQIAEAEKFLISLGENVNN